jgi:alpha-glucosidase
MANVITKLVDGLRLLGARVTLEATLYPYRKTYYSGKFARAGRSKGSVLGGLGALLARPRADAPPPAYLFPGRVLAHRWQHGQRIELTCENAMVQITVLAPDLLRVRVSPTGRLSPPFSYAIARADDEWPPVELSVEELEDCLMIRTSRLHCRIDKAHLAITFLDPDGTVVNADAAGAGWEQGSEKVLCWKHMPPGEHVYGLGQKTTRLDKQGLAFEMWNRDPQCYDPGEDPIYSNIPFYQGLVDGRAYGLFFDNPARGRVDFGVQTPGITRFEAECGEMRYYFFYGPELTTVLDRYTELTGRMAMPPLWALGYHQNRWSYYPEARVREIAGQFRERRIPCEAIHLDIDYMDGFRCFTWDRERFPDPAGLIADLHNEGFKVVTMLDPGIKVDPEYWVYREGLQENVFCAYPDNKPFRGPVWPGECCFPDFTSPRVRSWWGALYEGMVDLGVDGFWNDMNEPAVMGQEGDTFPDVVQHEWEGLGADHRTAHNAYGMQMARATVEGLKVLRPDERPFVISRSIWAGTQRYNMHWLGDNRSDWASLRNTVQLALNMGLSGIAFTGPDTGGFDGTPTAELLVRWNQLGVFTPFFRNHTSKGTKDQEPWAFGQDCERISRQFIELRYHLLPYHYTAFWQSAQRGIPMMRPLVLAFQDDPHVPGLDDEFMFGDAFLVAPILEEGATSRRAYIPQGKWYDFWDGTLTAGPQIARLEGPLNRIPLLVRAGSVVPAWPVMQYTAERPVEQLVLHVYPGDGRSWLYEDDGHTWAFQEGAQRTTRFECTLQPSKGTTRPQALRLERLAEGTFAPGYERIQVAVHGLSVEPTGTSVDGQPVADLLFDAQARTAAFETGLFRTLEVTLN